MSRSWLERLCSGIWSVGVPKDGLRLGVERWPRGGALNPNGLHMALVVEDPLVVLGCPDGVALALALALPSLRRISLMVASFCLRAG